MKALFAKPTSPKPATDVTRARTFLIFDAANIAARAHHTFWTNNRLTTKDGRKSGHIFGVLRMIRTAFERFRKGPTAIVIALEGYTAERYSLFPAYKANRRKVAVSEEAALDDPRTEQVLAMLTLPSFGLLAPFGEADDAIASFARSLEPHKRAYVFSSDRDLWQLAAQRVGRSGLAKVSVVLDKFVEVDPAMCLHRLKVLPEQVALLKSVYGDSSDNIPRVYRMPKAFKEVIRANPGWTTPDDLFAALDNGEIEEKTALKLVEHEDQIRTMFKVVSLGYDAHTIVEPFGSKDGLNDLISNYELNSLRDLPETWF